MGDLSKTFADITSPQSNELIYDESTFSNFEKEICRLKIKYIKNFCITIWSYSNIVVNISKEIIKYINGLGIYYRNLKFDTSKQDDKNFVDSFIRYIKNSFLMFRIISDIVKRFQTEINNGSCITEVVFNKVNFNIFLGER